MQLKRPEEDSNLSGGSQLSFQVPPVVVSGHIEVARRVETCCEYTPRTERCVGLSSLFRSPTLLAVFGEASREYSLVRFRGWLPHLYLDKHLRRPWVAGRIRRRKKEVTSTNTTSTAITATTTTITIHTTATKTTTTRLLPKSLPVVTSRICS